MIETDAQVSRRLRRLIGSQGGVRRRGDNDVSPQPHGDNDAYTEPRAARAATAPWRSELAGDVSTRSAPGDDVRTRTAPTGKARTRPALAGVVRARKARPAAHEWQEARLPLLGRLWARAWLPSVLVAGCLVALMYLLQTSGVATVGYDIQRLQVERDDWQLRNEQLRLELAKRRSLTWIEAEATGRLGMVRAEPTALVYLKTTR